MKETFNRGATLLDTLIGVALMVVVFVGIYGAFQLSIDVVSNNKARTGALALSQERLEYIRSLSYDSVGTVGGIPSGGLEQTESVFLNGVSYTRKTLVLYMDDPKDGTGLSDENGIIADAKQVKITVSWSAKGGARHISLTSRMSPPGVEQTVSGGTLFISVADSASVPVSGATVSIQNLTVSPPIDVNVFTNSDGEVSFIGAPEGTRYEISITKNGYSSAGTYDADANNPNPNPGHLTVLDAETTAATFSIDVVGSMAIETHVEVGTTTEPIANMDVRMRGDKTIGTDGTGGPIYKYDQVLNSGAGGSVTETDMEWDTYTMTMDGAVTGYDIKESCEPQPVYLAAGGSKTVRLILEPHTAHSLLIDVQDDTGAVIEGAQVRLYRTPYDQSDATGSCGQVFFSGLSEGTVSGGNPYSIDITASGYEAFTAGDVDVSGASRFSAILNAL